ncbi:hypothetical protein WN982_27790 [Paraburkholderia sp. IMGN_8]|uniref:hypothetical protein n=1 Tax=Paraburkholderia sp. IMGN_8 TaxID=3136564 RepID=UPI0031012980
MAGLIPFYRNVDVVRARQNKSLLLPLPRVEADKLSLSVHAALDALRRGRGNASAVKTLMGATILTGLLAESGYETTIFEQLETADQGIKTIFNRGRETGTWLLEPETFTQFAQIVTTYDQQLRKAPVWELVDANETLALVQKGQPLHQKKKSKRKHRIDAAGTSFGSSVGGSSHSRL